MRTHRHTHTHAHAIKHKQEQRWLLQFRWRAAQFGPVRIVTHFDVAVRICKTAVALGPFVIDEIRRDELVLLIRRRALEEEQRVVCNCVDVESTNDTQQWRIDVHHASRQTRHGRTQLALLMREAYSGIRVGLVVVH